MPRFPKEKIDEQYKKLPDALKDAIFSVDVANKIFEIGKKFALTIEETGFLGEEAGYVMLGLVHPNDFAKSIQARIEVDEEEIQQVAKEVNAQVFYPIRELFKRAHQFEVIAAEEKTAEGKPKEAIPTAKTAAPPAKTFEEIKFKEIEEEIKKETPPPLSQKPFFSKPSIEIKPVPAPQAQSIPQKPTAGFPTTVKPAAPFPAKPVEDSSPLPRPVVRPVPVEKPPSMPPTDKKEPSQPLVVPPKPELQPAPPPLTQRIPPIDLRKPKPEITGGVILSIPPRLAPSAPQPQPSVKSEDKKSISLTPQMQPSSEKPPEKPAARRVDPYREAAE